jgi:hypothetical protein
MPDIVARVSRNEADCVRHAILGCCEGLISTGTTYVRTVNAGLRNLELLRVLGVEQNHLPRSALFTNVLSALLAQYRHCTNNP